MKDLYSVELPALGDTSCSMKARRPPSLLAASPFGGLGVCCCLLWTAGASRQLHTLACTCSTCGHLPPTLP